MNFIVSSFAAADFGGKRRAVAREQAGSSAPENSTKPPMMITTFK
jgi:hypothetical protein